MLVSAFGFRDILGTHAVVLDPSRVAAQIVTGIGFLGAGTIILQKEMVQGLTTAASIWVVAAIGAAVGGGMYVLAGIATALTLGVLAGLRVVEDRWFTPQDSHSLSLTFDSNALSLSEIESSIERQGYHLDRLVLRPSGDGEPDQLDLILGGKDGGSLTSLLDKLHHTSGIRQISSGKASLGR
jgi:putative Mg2+ transporter-C (MgtC) family protein